jgi:uncharacterized damage-inducible protein DinB
MSHSRIQTLLTELRDAYDGEPWYSDSLRATLDGIDETRANANPLAGAHSIAELVAHITAWIEVMNRRLDGEVFEVTMDVNFRAPANWTDDLQRLDAAHKALLGRVSAMADDDLDRKLAGKPHTIEFGVRGVVQHNIYHQGQIALLKKG